MTSPNDAEQTAPQTGALANELWHELRLAGEITFQQEIEIAWKWQRRFAELCGKFERQLLRAAPPTTKPSSERAVAEKCAEIAFGVEGCPGEAARRIRAYAATLRDTP